MKNLYLILTITLIAAINFIHCYRILCILPTFRKSHWIIGSATAKALASAGHDVTMISAFPLKKPPLNYHDIELTGLLSSFPG